MSKQYLTLHTLENAHPSDIFALGATKKQLLSASGSSSIRVFDTSQPDYPLAQTIEGAHKLGIHHLVVNKEGKRAASAGFEGTARIWDLDESGQWIEGGLVTEGTKSGNIWAIALSADGNYLASSSINGVVHVWEIRNAKEIPKIREYETKGSFGLCIDLSADGRFTASGHESGNIYIFNNESGRLAHSLAGLIKAVRAVAFSPASKLVAAAGDARIIALYDVNSGEQVANFSGHGGWIMTLDWSDTGEYILSGSHDSKAKIWSLESRSCVATHSHGDKPLWAARWLPKVTNSEMFALGGGNAAISFYREAAGG